MASSPAWENRRLEEVCTPSPRELSDNELSEKTIDIFEESDGNPMPRLGSIQGHDHGYVRIWRSIERRSKNHGAR